MADKKISELNAITGANTASGDLFVIVDVDANETKKITRDELTNALELTDFDNIDINGGTIDGTTIGGSVTAAGGFTSLGADVITITSTQSAPLADAFIYRPGSDTLGLGVQGSERLRITTTEMVLNEAGNNYDFRVESDTSTHALFVDAGNNTVSVNRTGGVGQLNVKRTTTGEGIHLYNSNNAYPTASTGYTDITGTFYDYLNGGDTGGGTATIRFESRNANAGSRSSQITFRTTPADGTNTTQEVARFHNAEVSFNEDSRDQDFRVESDNKGYMFYIDAGTDTAYFGGSDDRGFVNIEKDAPLASNGAFTSPHIALQALTQPTDNDGFVGISFATSDSDNYGFTIGAQRTSAGQGNFVFRNHSNDATGTVMMEIKSGSGIVINDDGGNQDFRVESDANTHALFVDAGNNRVGINTSTPQGTFSVLGTHVVQNASNVQVITAGTTSGNGLFKVFNSSGTAMFRVDAAASRVGINTDSPGASLDVRGSVIFNEDSADADFRVESDTNTHALFVDAGNSRVGVNVVSPATELEVRGTVPITASRDLQIIGADSGFGHYRFSARYDATNYGVGASINALSEGAWSSTSLPTKLMFYTVPSGSTTLAERLRLSPTEAVFNDGSNDTDFRVESDNDANALFVRGSDGYVGVGLSGVLSKFHVAETSAKRATTITGNANAQGTAQKHTIVRQYPVVSLGTKLIIPFISQGSLNSTTICKVMGHGARYNNTTPLGFEITFALAHLNALYNLQSWGGNGNFSSIAVNGMNIEITFTSAYTNATADGVFVTLEYMTNRQEFSIDVSNIAMN